MLAVKETEITYAKLCERYFASKDTTSNHRVVVNTSRVEISTKHVKIYSVLREV